MMMMSRYVSGCELNSWDWFDWLIEEEEEEEEEVEVEIEVEHDDRVYQDPNNNFKFREILIEFCRNFVLGWMMQLQIKSFLTVSK